MEDKKIEGAKQEKPKMRQIIIEFDSNQIKIVKAEVSSTWEMQSILQNALKTVIK